MKDKVVIIGGSAGSFRIISEIIAAIPANFPFPVLVCIHRLRNVRSGFLETLGSKAKIPMIEPFDKEIIKTGHCYLAPANYHMMVEDDRTFSLSLFKPVIYSRPCINLLFESAAEVYNHSAIGVLLSGANTDGAEGLAMLHQHGAMTIVQDPSDAEVPIMPEAALSLFQPDLIMDAAKIISFIKDLKS